MKKLYKIANVLLSAGLILTTIGTALISPNAYAQQKITDELARNSQGNDYDDNDEVIIPKFVPKLNKGSKTKNCPSLTGGTRKESVSKACEYRVCPVLWGKTSVVKFNSTCPNGKSTTAKPTAIKPTTKLCANRKVVKITAECPTSAKPLAPTSIKKRTTNDFEGRKVVVGQNVFMFKKDAKTGKVTGVTANTRYKVTDITKDGMIVISGRKYTPSQISTIGVEPLF